MIGGPPEVVEHPVHVRDGHVVGDEPTRAFRAEWRRGYDVSCNTHDLARELRCGSVQTGVAAQDEIAAAHLTLGGPHAQPVAALETQRTGILEYPDALACGRGREAQGVVERMQMAAVGIVQATQISVGLQQGAEVTALIPAQRWIPVVALELVAESEQLVTVAWLDRCLELTVDPVALDLVFCDQAAHQ